jgi:hydroxyacyl-ACP dehydratase HTD2-like protein with hotdog domain
MESHPMVSGLDNRCDPAAGGGLDAAALSAADRQRLTELRITYPEVEITRELVQRYDVALGRADRRSPAQTLAPVLVYTLLTRPPTPIAELQPAEHDPPTAGPGGGRRVVFGGLTVELIRPVRVGDRLRGVRRVHSIEEKAGRTGPLVIVHWLTEFVDATDALVLRELSRQVIR